MTAKEKKVWKNIIELYRDLPHLWDKHNANYSKRNMREEGFKKILKLYNELDQDATVQIIKKKIENIRTSFARELKKVKASAGTEEVYVPSLWYYDLLMFLDGHMELSRAGIDATDAANNTQDSEQSTDKKTPIKWRRKKRRMSVAIEHEKLNNSKEDEWEITGKFIAMQLKDVSKEQLIFANKIISDTIFYAKIGRLTADSTINLGAADEFYIHSPDTM